MSVYRTIGPLVYNYFTSVHHVCFRKQLIGTKWDKCFFFTQGGNLMSQMRGEVCSLVVGLQVGISLLRG